MAQTRLLRIAGERVVVYRQVYYEKTAYILHGITKTYVRTYPCLIGSRVNGEWKNDMETNMPDARSHPFLWCLLKVAGYVFGVFAEKILEK